jgi:hypothetical protein
MNKRHNIQARYRRARLGLTGSSLLPDAFRGRAGTSAGRPGDGGGEKRRWLKLKREDVEESGPRSAWLYEAALRRFIRGGDTIILECRVRERSSVGGILKQSKR